MEKDMNIIKKDINIFSDLKDLGFDNISNIDIYCKEKKEEKLKPIVKVDEGTYLYDKEVVCPVCGNTFKVHMVRTNAYKMKNKESDFYINYSLINPYFYDVWLCNECGYASIKSDFKKLRDSEIELIQENITTKWHGREYPAIYDLKIAIERYKLSLLSHTIIGSKSSKKAMNCLKLTWMYRLLKDTENEQLFTKQAIFGFNEACFKDDFPIYGMDKFMTMYLIGELNRRIGNDDEALRQFSNVITSQMAGVKIKDLARDQKDLIRRSNNTIEHSIPTGDTKKKNGIFSRLFN